MRYVIIGNSAAAVGCIEGIRQLDKGGSVTVISSEPYHTYSRPLISYLLWGKTTEEGMKYRPDGFYEQNGCRALLGRAAVGIDPKKKQVTLDGGETLPYDKLLVAAGSRPFVPPMEGLDGVKNSFTFMSLDDARALGEALRPDSRVLVVGAGLIGLKCVEGIRDRVGEVTVADLAGRILPSVLDEAGAALMQRHIESHGVRFLLGDSVAAFEGNTARMKSGASVEFDILVTAVGVRTSLDALTSRAAQLPGIRLDRPGRVIGKNTVDCMRSGIMYGTAAMLDGLVERIEAELGHKSTLIATGGLAQFITPLCKREIILEKDLLLKGLNVIYKKNKR